MKYLSLFLIAILIFSCSPNYDEILKEATEVYKQSLEIEQEILPKFEELEQASNSINIQGRALTEEEIKFTRDVELLGLRLNYWKENHIEVPKADSLQNQNRSTVKFSAKDILLIQKEFNDSIIAIRARVNTIKTPS